MKQKKFLAIVLCIAMCCSLFPTWAFADAEVSDEALFQDEEAVWAEDFPEEESDEEEPDEESAGLDGESPDPSEDGAMQDASEAGGTADPDAGEDTAAEQTEDPAATEEPVASGETETSLGPVAPAEEDESFLADPEDPAGEDEQPVEEADLPEDEPGEQEAVQYVVYPEIGQIPDDGIDNETLLNGYAQAALDSLRPGAVDAQADRIDRGALLTGLDRKLYDALRTRVEKAASGELSSSKFVIPFSELGLKSQYTFTELGVNNFDDAFEAAEKQFICDMRSVISALLADCPYALYWFDKTGGYLEQGYEQMSGAGNSVIVEGEGYQVVLSVAQEYFDGTTLYEYQYLDSDNNIQTGYMPVGLNTTYGTMVSNAKANVAGIVAEFAAYDDYNKLLAYKNRICDLVSYNDAAADKTTGTAYGNPWQLIWVFDNDPTTEVVCEGYSKAFQYLCELSTFTGDVGVYSVTGTMAGGTGAGGHMWNIVSMSNGKNYLVDVTNCDDGTIGAPDKLFMAGYSSGSVSEGYTFEITPRDSISFIYDSEALGLYGEDLLTLSDMNYLLDDQTPAQPGEALIAPEDPTWGLDSQGNAVPGMVRFRPMDPDSGDYHISYYHAENDTLAHEGSITVHNLEHMVGNWVQFAGFINAVSVFDSGDYYFTVQTIDWSGERQNSPVATSGVWTYVKPDVQLPTPTANELSGPQPNYDFVGDSDLIGGAFITLYFSATETDVSLMDPYSMEAIGDKATTDSQLSGWMKYQMTSLGEGNYAWKLQLFAKDILTALNSETSAVSPVTHLTAGQISGSVSAQKLNPPTGLQWHVFETGHDLIGLMSFTKSTDNPTQWYELNLYQTKDGVTTLRDTITGEYEYTAPMAQLSQFLTEDWYESGYDYYFTVTALSQDTASYSDSDTVKSAVWHYEQAATRMNTVTGIGIDGEGQAVYTMPADLSHYAGFVMEYLYRPTLSDTQMNLGPYPTLIRHTMGPGDESPAVAFMSRLKTQGPGFYSWRVRLVSDDITVVDKSEWSDWSPETEVTEEQIAELHRPNEFRNLKQLKNYCAQSYSEPTGIHFGENEPFTLTEDLVIPENLMVWFPAPQNDVYVDAGVTLTLDGSLLLQEGLTVDGALINNGSIGLHNGNGDMATLTVNGDYSGEGRLLVNYLGQGHIANADPDSFFYGVDLSNYERTHTDSSNNECVFTYTWITPLEAYARDDMYSVTVVYEETATLEVVPVPAPDSGTLHYTWQSGTNWTEDGYRQVFTYDNDSPVLVTEPVIDYRDYVCTVTDERGCSCDVHFSVSFEQPEGYVGKDVRWTLSDGVLTLSGTGATWNYFFESSQMTPWTSQRQEITKIVVEPGITAIGSYLFGYLTNLTEVTLPDGLLSLGDYAFDNCEHLQNIAFPSSLTEIGTYAFFNCASLEKVELPENLTRLQNYVFMGCESLTELTVPLSLTSVGEGCFASCPALTTVNYEGTPAGWSLIAIEDGNEPLTKAYAAQLGIPEGFSLKLNREYLLLKQGTEYDTLIADGLTDYARQYLVWSAEKNDGTITVDPETGAITAGTAAGTDYVVAMLDLGDEVYTAHCRVDVAENVTELSTVTASLTEDKVTVELYRTDYTRLGIILAIEQNQVSTASDVETPEVGDEPESAHTAILKAVRLESRDKNDVTSAFTLNIVDDRNVEIIPLVDVTDPAAVKAANIKGSYKVNVIATIDDGTENGRELDPMPLTITVKKTLPKLKAAPVKLNRFIGQSAEVAITGGVVTGFTADTYGNAVAMLSTDIPVTVTPDPSNEKNGSARFNLTCELEDWAVTAKVTVSVSSVLQKPKQTYKPATVTLNPSLDTVTDCAQVAYTLTPLPGMENWRVYNGYHVYEGGSLQPNSVLQVYMPDDSTVTVQPGRNFDPSVPHTYKVFMLVGGQEVSSFTVKTLKPGMDPSVTAKAAGAIDLAVKNSPVTVTLTGKNCNPAAADIYTVTVLRNNKKLGVTDEDVTEYFTWDAQDNVITLRAADSLAYDLKDIYVKGDAYTAVIENSLAEIKPVAFTVKSSAKTPAVSVAYKAAGSIDVLRPGTSVTVTPTVKNWYGRDLELDDLRLYRKDGASYTDVTEEYLFGVSFDGKAYTLTADGTLNPKDKYFAAIPAATVGAAKQTYGALSVKMGKAAVAQSTKAITLSKMDCYDRQSVILSLSDPTLESIGMADVVLVDKSGNFELTRLGSGKCAIGYAGSTLPKNIRSLKTATVQLKVYLAGNGTHTIYGTDNGTPNATLKVKITLK